MIEVNLLPGGKKGTARGGPLAGLAAAFKARGSSRSGGGGSSSAGADPYMAFFAIAASVLIGYTVWAYLGVNGEHEELEVAVEEERVDSVRFADLIERTNLLSARNDSIAQRVSIIQQIDAGRYVWPHVLDEVAAAVPDYTWLREVLYAGGDPVQVRVNGRAGSIYAITNFMRRLEASRFLRAVQMDRAEQVPSDASPGELVYVFELVMTYETPPFEELETVPLFDAGALSTQIAAPTGELTMAWYNPTDPKQRNWMVAGIVALLLIIPFRMYFLAPRQEENQTLRDRLEALETQNRRASVLAAQGGGDLEERMALYERHVGRLEQLIPAAEEVAILADDIANRARIRGVELQRMVPEPRQPGTYYDQTSYTMAVVGEYHGVARFLTDIASLSRIVTPIELDLQPFQQPDMFPNMESPVIASFRIETYVLPDPANPAAQPEGQS